MSRQGIVALAVLALMGLAIVPSIEGADDERFGVVPFEFDPGRTNLVQSGWRTGIGCPTTATILPFLPDGTVGPPAPFADPGCPTGDPKDARQHEGLLLVKTGPTVNFASAGVELEGVQGTVLTELGYDIRKFGAPASAVGSHCGAGAPRFNVVVGGTTYFIGCNSPPGTVTAASDGWTRLRWTGAALGGADGQTVDAISIVFDEAQDTGPDQLGLVVLDNIDVNGVLVGRAAPGGR